MKPTINLAVALTLWFCGPLVAHALTWQHQYEGDLLPDAPGSILNSDLSTSSWTLNNSGSPELTTVTGGVLYYTSDRQEGNGGRRDWLIGTTDTATGDSRWDASTALTLDIRFQIGENDSNGDGARFNWADGDWDYDLDVAKTRAKSTGQNQWFDLDLAGGFADLRVAIDGVANEGTAYLRDHTGAEAEIFLELGERASPRNFMFMASPRCAGESGCAIDLEIDYIRWTNEGAFDFSQEIDLIEVPPGTAGDYNDDGAVNLADYTVWRNNLGSNTVLNNDLIGGTIGQQQYEQWKSHFGLNTASVRSSVVPEPASALITVLGAMLLYGPSGLGRTCR